MNDDPGPMKRAAYALLAWLARAICLTLRLRRVNAAPVDAIMKKQDGRCIIAFWHGSMIPGWFFHRPAKGKQGAALVSLSKDGAILASVLEHWGFRLIRGSSHIGGKEALRMMTEAIDEGSMLCITPDGPTGPRHVMKAGALLAARRTGVPLVVAGIAVKKKKVLGRSWDRFEIPMPFSRVCIWYDEPILQPAPDADETPEARRQAVDELLASVQVRLEEAQARAHRALGIDEFASRV